MVRPELQILLAGASSLLALAGMSGGGDDGRSASGPVAALSVVKAAGRTELRREADGLFYLDGRVNGGAVRFLIDTGANVTVLTQDDAERLGLAKHNVAAPRRLRTVSGTTLSAWARVEQIELGGRSFRDVDVLVVGDGMPVSLLGQDMLARMGPMLIDGDRLTVAAIGSAK